MRKNRTTTLPEVIIHQTRTKLAEDGMELTFEEVDQKLRQAIDSVRGMMKAQGYSFPNDDYGAMKLIKLVMMGN